MANYILKRLLLMIPTLFGIMLISFIIIQFVPGGPVERMIAQLQGHGVEATARFGGAAGGVLGMILFRHKKNYPEFKRRLGLSLTLHAAILYALW